MAVRFVKRVDRSRSLIKTGLVAVVLALVLQPDISLACPNCKNGLVDQSATGFALSILFMLAVPFTIFSSWLLAALRGWGQPTRSPQASANVAPQSDGPVG